MPAFYCFAILKAKLQKIVGLSKYSSRKKKNYKIVSEVYRMPNYFVSLHRETCIMDVAAADSADFRMSAGGADGGRKCRLLLAYGVAA